MFRVLVVLAALSAVALAIEDRGIFRRFMDLMGSECGAFGCKRDTQVSRAVRDYAYALRDADQKDKRHAETLDKLHALQRRLVNLGQQERTPLAAEVKNLRDKTKRYVDLAERDEEPISKAVRSIKDYAANLKRDTEQTLSANQVKRSLLNLQEQMMAMKRDTKELRAPMAFKRNSDDKVARALDNLFAALEEK